MRIALIGATGYVGSALLHEAMKRGHAVTAIVRDPSKLAVLHPGLTIKKGDILREQELNPLVTGQDLLLSAYNAGWKNPNLYEDFLAGYRAILAAARLLKSKRVIAIGGAGSLEIEPGHQLVDSPDFPEAWKTGALAARELLNRLRQEKDLQWTFVSPPIQLEPGEPAGRYRIGGDEVLADAQGVSRITLSDFAAAVLDEAEKPRHLQRRFTVAY